jgi:hypothetical protein
MTITLQHPYTSPTTTLTLPNPDLGNIEALNLKTTMQFAMDGTIRTNVHGPSNKKLSYTISTIEEATCGSVTKEEMTNLISFIEAAGGDYIKLTDWNSDVWQVKIVTPIAEFVQYARDFHRVALEFEGTKS